MAELGYKDKQVIMIKAARQKETTVRILRSKSCYSEEEFMAKQSPPKPKRCHTEGQLEKAHSLSQIPTS